MLCVRLACGSVLLRRPGPVGRRGYWRTVGLTESIISELDTDHHFVHRSTIPTMHFQDSLPRLPVPKLEDTVKRYLAAQKPLLDDDQYRNTERIAREFEKGVGRKLHRDLVEFDKKNKHTSYISGKGFDRHLFALKHLSVSRGDPMPELFLDSAYQKLNHIILSTSTLHSPAVHLGGFGPVVPDGFGIGYNVFDTWVGCNTTGYLSRELQEFLRCLEYSLNDILDVLEGRPLV
uniref:Choline/carnitine acyltransferase domain-containing protein n=1 Tax=Chelonoidis abingdonii TaxID=106734 RepID=A0A8C0QRA5_CHEAB